MGISRSGYYASRRRPESNRARRQREMLECIRRIHEESHNIYGSPTITEALHADGIACSRGMIARLMRKNGIRSKVRKKFKATTNSSHNLPVANNILNREFKTNERNRKWVSDITYIWTDEGWLYLAGILDLYDGAIVGWSIDSQMTKELAMRALIAAVEQREPGEGLILHSDRGSQYCSFEYQKEIALRGFTCSMSRKGNCWDNAPMESFWGKLKTEWLSWQRFRSRADAKRAVFEYIELFYNRRRLRSVNGYVPPLKMKPAA